jgi:hypothetical protein
MTEPPTITLKSLVDRSEKAAVRKATELLENTLSSTVGGLVSVRCQFEDSLEGLMGSGEPSVVISSLLPEVANHQQSWAAVASRLSKAYRGLAAADGADQRSVFICTVFRRVPTDEMDAQSRLTMIRRLNLLAAELSRETGFFVIDLDRRLADIGAAKIQTDYRLEGPHAEKVVAKEIALAVVSAGLDAFLPFEVQDAAKLSIASTELGLAASKVTATDALPSNVLALGAGRRKQVVATVVDTDAESHVGWLLHLLLTGRLSPKEAASKLGRSVASRGLRASSAMVFSAARQALFRRTRVGR